MDPVKFRVAIPAADPAILRRSRRRLRFHVSWCELLMTDRFGQYRQQWFAGGATARADILAGIVVALALIPEPIGFSIIVGGDPRVGAVS